MLKRLFLAALVLMMGVALVNQEGCSRKPKGAGEEMVGVEKGRKVRRRPIGEDEYVRRGVSPLQTAYFDFDRANIRPEMRTVLQRNAEWLRRHPRVKIIIEGHCDERGSEEYNMALGQRRAEAVKSYLVSLGISSNRLSTISYGKERPADPGHSETAWAKNRRVEFSIVR
ncbi:MAG: peptidoglycan-associated lipoprotein Pal [Nitrospirota bacterium]|nr:peptidoglycan-associated lipoprotein Pal [Nitrospirota bacterium]